MDKTTTLEEIKAAGFERGKNIASWVDMPDAGKTYRTESDGPIVADSVAQAELIMLDQASQAEENNRSYSPFEFTAHAINERDDSEAAWQVYNDGINEGMKEAITARLASYKDEDFEE